MGAKVTILPANPSLAYREAITKHSLLNLPNKTKKTTRDRAFFAAVSTLWNALPDELRALGSLKTFMARLKTHVMLGLEPRLLYPDSHMITEK